MTYVLVADADATVRAFLANRLRLHNYVAIESASVLTTVSYLQETVVPHIVLLDYLLPPDGGLSVLSAVTADFTRLGRHAVILMSSPPLENPFPWDHFLVPVLQKPFTPRQLFQQVITSTASLHRTAPL